MKKIVILFVMSLFLVACSKKEETSLISETSTITITDSLGTSFSFDSQPNKVVALGASLTDIWLLSGGELAGTSSDSFEREDFNLNQELVTNVGSLETVNIEEIMKIEPDLVIFSANIKGQVSAASTLSNAGIPVFFVDIQSFDDYLGILQTFTQLNDADALYEQNGVAVQTERDNYITLANEMEKTSGLFLRSSASTLKVLAQDSFQVKIMEDMGIENIAKSDSAILDDLSIEAILKSDPKYIFLVVMGEEAEGLETITEYITQNPAWNELTAVKEGRFITLPKELFHNKPNARWGEAYGQIYHIRTQGESTD